MRAAVTTGPRRIQVESVPDPDPGPGDAVVDVGTVGLCGTDLHMFLGERHDTGFPLRQGHEVGGTLTALPRGYAGPLQVGQTVTIDPAIPCGTCRPCRRGRWPACTRFRALGVALPGGLADQVVAPVGQLHDAAGLTTTEAALAEPFSIAAMAMSQAELYGDERLVVVGAGPIGLAITVCAVARGHEVLGSDPVPSRRALAAELGAALAVDPADGGAEAIRDRTRGEGADTAFEASGTRPGLTDSLAALGNGGRLVVVGVAAHDLTVPVPRVLFEGLTIVGARAGLFPEALEIVADRRSAVARFASRTYPLDEVADAFGYAVDHARDVVKVMVER
jgi:threonine dehydrogenase-like Zn-dependent dehydrogenase